MGMEWVARLANDDQATSIKENPERAFEFICPVDDEEFEKAEASLLDLDKEWHATHFLLANSSEYSASPLSFILGDYEHVGEDLGYGPAYYIEPKQIKAFHKALSSLSDNEIASRYDGRKMARQDIYLAEALQTEEKEGLTFLMKRVSQLREFAQKGADSRHHAFCVIT